MPLLNIYTEHPCNFDEQVKIKSGVADILSRLLNKEELAVTDAVKLLGGMGKFVKKGVRVIIKPNLAYPYPPSAITNPEFVNAIVQLCFEPLTSSVGVGDSFSNSCKNIPGTGKWDNKGLMEALGISKDVEVTGAVIRDFDFEQWEKVENLRYGLGKRASCMTGCPPIPSLHKVVEEIQKKISQEN